MGDVVGDRPPQPVPARAFRELELAVAVAGGDEWGVPELDVGVREGHLDLVVGPPETGVEWPDRARDSDVLAAGGGADSGQ
ncbi:hypothetical protein [Rhodococcus rhodochrous]|uniref:hypothetical protein n=1 Tax=Rhodococcus rhodochrous TaxID=1829 RepID=UPI0024BB7455|nr:hypothetical protein [Rhodococcus rhodochrous]MDJ0401245.1 hypothetical protein [Rhodococcus rhodochrous]